MEEKRYYFRYQYQIGEITISEHVGGYGYLPVSQMICAILILVKKILLIKANLLGGKVALEGLRLIVILVCNSNVACRVIVPRQHAV